MTFRLQDIVRTCAARLGTILGDDETDDEAIQDLAEAAEDFLERLQELRSEEGRA